MNMAPGNYYKNIIWTDHVLERLKNRKITQEIAWQTFNNPDKLFKGKEAGTNEYQKRFSHSTVTLIAKQNEKGEWVILSCWMDPPLPGTEDARKKERYMKYKESSFAGKLWLTLLKQIGF